MQIFKKKPSELEDHLDALGYQHNMQTEALRVMSEDFMRMCPDMGQVACDAAALRARYLGHAAQGTRPSLPLKWEGVDV